MLGGEGKVMARSSVHGVAELDPAAPRGVRPTAMRAISELGALRTARRLAEGHRRSRPPQPHGQSPGTKRRSRLACRLLFIVATATMAWAGPAFGHAQIADALALCYPKSGNIKHVASRADLEDALSTAAPGDHIVVASGIYGGNFTLSRSGTASDPIVLKSAASSDRPRMTGRFKLSGNYGVLEGFEFTGEGGVSIQRGDFNRVTRNFIHDFSHRGIYVHKAQNNRIDHNEIADQQIPGQRAITIAIRRGDDSDFVSNNRIDHNYIHDLPDQGKNGHEPIYVGSGFGAWVNTRTLIDHNLLERAKAEGEIIGLKTSLNNVIGNTATQTGGYFSNRLGHGNVWKNNWLDGTDLRVYGKGTQIIGNHLVNANIHLLRGTLHQEELENALRGGIAPAATDPVAENTLVVGNSGGTVFIGAKYKGPLAVRNARLEANAARIVKKHHVNTYESEETSIDYGTARKLTPSDVGLNATDPSCP
jgi:Chondroitinase B